MTKLNSQIAELTDLLQLERSNNTDLNGNLAALPATLATTTAERDKLQTQVTGIGGATDGKDSQIAGLSTDLAKQKDISADAAAQVALLNQQLAALRTQIGALEQALNASESDRDREQDAGRRSRSPAQRRAGAARAGSVAVPLGLLRPAAQDPRGPRRRAGRRRPLRVPVRGAVPAGRRLRVRRRQAGARQSRRGDQAAAERNPARYQLGAAHRRPHRQAADQHGRSSRRTGS